MRDLDEPHAYSLPSLRLNQWALAGTWTVARHAGVLNERQRTDRVPFPRARREPRDGSVSQGAAVPFRVFLDGQPADAAAGVDVDANGGGTVDAQRTYQLIRQSGSISERQFEIEFLAAGVEAYCFTFG